MVRRRRSRRLRANQNLPGNSGSVSQNLEDLKNLAGSQWTGSNLETNLKCESDFFCEVLSRLSKEIKCARDLNDLDNIVSLASKFILASAAKEKATARQIAASNGKPFQGQDAFDFDADGSDNEIE